MCPIIVITANHVTRLSPQLQICEKNSNYFDYSPITVMSFRSVSVFETADGDLPHPQCHTSSQQLQIYQKTFNYFSLPSIWPIQISLSQHWWHLERLWMVYWQNDHMDRMWLDLVSLRLRMAPLKSMIINSSQQESITKVYIEDGESVSWLP